MMAFSILAVSVLLLFCNKCCGTFDYSEQSPLLSEDGRSNWKQLATKYGFPNVEEREVVTEDGYILTLYHIPGDPSKPLLLSHGNTVNSYCWIVRGPISPAIILAKRGYDVWVINYRGVSESRRHTHLDVDTQAKQFYNFSFYEQAVYDLPATIDLILRETKQTSLLAIGHSVGTLDFYVLGAEKPEYNDKVKAFISLAPISFLQNLHGAGSLLLLQNVLLGAGTVLGVTDLPERSGLGGSLFNGTCLGPLGYPVCVQGLIFQLFGPDEKGFETEFRFTFFGQYPDLSSKKMFDHLLQIENTNRFARFDYGKSGNLLEYGTEEAPLIDLGKTTMKQVLLVGANDYLATVPDAERLRAALPHVEHYEVLPYDSFNHFDFVWGRYMPTNLYPSLLPWVEKFI